MSTLYIMTNRDIREGGGSEDFTRLIRKRLPSGTPYTKAEVNKAISSSVNEGATGRLGLLIRNTPGFKFLIFRILIRDGVLRVSK